MTVHETAAALRVSRSTVYRLIASGELAVTKVRRRTLVTEDSAAEYIAAATTKHGEQVA